MAEFFGFEPAGTSDAEVLQAIHDHFEAAAGLWRVKAGSALNGGADGFIAERIAGGGPLIAFRRGGGLGGGTMRDGSAVAAGGLFAGIDPGAELSDVSSGSGDFGDAARWSGWLGTFAEATVGNRGRIKVIEEADRILLRQKKVGTAEYTAGLLAGLIADPVTSAGTGAGVLAGLFDTIYADNSGTQAITNTRTYEAEPGMWAPCHVQGNAREGLRAPHDSDGAGGWRYARVGLVAWYNTASESTGFLVGVLRDLYVSTVQAEGTLWRNPPDHPTAANAVRAVYFLDGYLCADDGTVAE